VTIAAAENATQQAVHGRYMESLGKNETADELMRDLSQVRQAGREQVSRKVLALVLAKRDEELPPQSGGGPAMTAAGDAGGALNSLIVNPVVEEGLQNVTTCSMTMPGVTDSQVAGGTRGVDPPPRNDAQDCEDTLIELLKVYRRAYAREAVPPGPGTLGTGRSGTVPRVPYSQLAVAASGNSPAPDVLASNPRPTGIYEYVVM
jgi:hypothetical protein